MNFPLGFFIKKYDLRRKIVTLALKQFTIN